MKMMPSLQDQTIQFRIWATQLITEYIIKGLALDDEPLKKGYGQVSRKLAEQKAKS